MPSAYTHHLIANDSLSLLPSELCKRLEPYLSLYFFGAQGADFCFFYKPFLPKRKNFGSYLHRKGGYDAFCVLKSLSHCSTPALAYTLGYLTHYAVDATFHPFVYEAAESSLLRHSFVENALDRYFRRTNGKENERFFRKKLTKTEESELFFLYTAIAVSARFPVLEKPPFLRAIKLFNAYLPTAYAFFGKGGEYYAPLPPPKPQKADELRRQALLFCEQLFSEFLQAMEQGTPLSRELFARSYLTGK
jgi:hypothetical protein